MLRLRELKNTIYSQGKLPSNVCVNAFEYITSIKRCCSQTHFAVMIKTVRGKKFLIDFSFSIEREYHFFLLYIASDFIAYNNITIGSCSIS